MNFSEIISGEGLDGQICLLEPTMVPTMVPSRIRVATLGFIYKLLSLLNTNSDHTILPADRLNRKLINQNRLGKFRRLP